MTTDPIEAEIDASWERYADEAEWGSEFSVEWGVRFTYPNSGFHVSECNDEAEARELAATTGTPADRVVVARRVITSAWGER